MADREVIMDRIDMINMSLKRLKELANISKDNFVKNDDYFAIAEHHLRRALEATLDIGRHICVKDNLGQPQDYTEIFEILGKYGVLDDEFANKIRGMEGYRNRLVHMYNQVSVEELYQILQEKLDDFQVFTLEVLNYITDNDDNDNKKSNDIN